VLVTQCALLHWGRGKKGSGRGRIYSLVEIEQREWKRENERENEIEREKSERKTRRKKENDEREKRRERARAVIVSWSIGSGAQREGGREAGREGGREGGRAWLAVQTEFWRYSVKRCRLDLERSLCAPVRAHHSRKVRVPEGHVRGTVDGIRVGNTEEGVAGEYFGTR
jgi:hypothetical protein